MSLLFPVTPVYDGTIEELSCWGDGAPDKNISFMIYVAVCVEKVIVIQIF